MIVNYLSIAVVVSLLIIMPVNSQKESCLIKFEYDIFRRNDLNYKTIKEAHTNNVTNYSECDSTNNTYYTLTIKGQQNFYLGSCLPNECKTDDTDAQLQEHLRNRTQASNLYVLDSDSSHLNFFSYFFIVLLVAYTIFLFIVKCIPTKSENQGRTDIENTPKTDLTAINADKGTEESANLLKKELTQTHKKEDTKEEESSLKVFDIIENAKGFFKVGRESDEDLKFYDGLRSFLSFIIIFLHTFLVFSYSMRKYDEKGMDKDVYAIICQHCANIAPLTFFVISGFFMSYTSLSKVKRFDGFWSFLWNGVVARFLRIWPLYAFVYFLSVLVIQHLGSGPSYPYMMANFYSGCKTKGWLMLCFLDNITEKPNLFSGVCLGHFWYMSIDFQCSIVGLILVGLYQFSGKKCYEITLIVITAFCLVANIFIVVMDNPTTSHRTPNSYFTKGFLTYVFGFVCGFYYYKLKKEKDEDNICAQFWTLLRENTPFAYSFLLLPIVLYFYVVLSQIFFHFYEFPAFVLSIYEYLHFPIIGFITFCLHSYLVNDKLTWLKCIFSNFVFSYFSKLTFSIYLLHFPFIYLFFSINTTDHNMNDFDLTLISTGIFFFTVILSFFTFLMFETPFIALKEKLSRKSKENEIKNK